MLFSPAEINASAAYNQAQSAKYNGYTGQVGYNASSPSLPVGTRFNQSTGAVQPSTGTGSVLGYSTSVPNNGARTTSAVVASSPQVSSAPAVQTPDIQALINNGINQLNASYDQGRTDSENQLQNIYNTQVSNINAQRDQALAKFPGYQEEVRNNQAKTLSDLANDTRNSFQAANVYLGNRGASDSSGADQYAFAIQQQANKNRANVNGQYATQFKQLQDQQIDVQNQATNAIAEADTQLAQQKAAVAQQYQAMKQQLASQGLQMSVQQAQDFTNYIRQQEAQANAYKQQILSGFQDRIAALDSYKTQIANSSNFNPVQVAQGELNATAAYAPTATDYAYSFYPALKKNTQSAS